GRFALGIERELGLVVLLRDQRVDERVDGRGALAAVLAHDQRGLAGEGRVFHRAHALGEVARQRRLAGAGPAEQAEDLRAGLVLEPGGNGEQRRVLLGGPLDHQRMLVLTVAMPSTPPSRRSPRTTAPTPAGVPVKTRSPAL